MSTGRSFLAEKVGIFTPKRVEKDILGTGEVGFLVAGIKDIFGAPVGDTVTGTDNPSTEQLTGFKKFSLGFLRDFIPSVLMITKVCANRYKN